MAKIVTISTKKGDGGESFLANGEKYPKDHPIFEVLGTIDELNSHIGLAVALLRGAGFVGFHDTVLHLEKVQSNLYLLSGLLAGAKISFPPSQLMRIEELGGRMQETMAEGWTTQFLYPGGSVIGAEIDIARTVCRKVERLIVALKRSQPVAPVVIRYINRLSDFLFIVRCFVNTQLGVTEKKFKKH